MSAVRDKTRAPCARCGEVVVMQPCGCWVDGRGTRWCRRDRGLHQPEGYEQPARCHGA